MAARIHGGVILLFFMFNIFVYFAHSSIGSLENVNYLDEASVINAEIRYKRKLNESLQDFKDQKNISIQKCCPKKYVLNGALECVLNINETNEETFFPAEMIREEDNFSGFVNTLVAADELQCRDQLIYLANEEPMSYYISVDTGDLVQITNNTKDNLIYYSTNYCLDLLKRYDTQRLYILMLCPCKEHLCIQKCCPIGKYFDTVTAKCSENLSLGHNPEIHFYDKNYNQFNYSVQHFFVHRIPNCGDQPDEIMNSTGDIFIHQDGYLMNKLTNEITDLDKYCVDVFSDGNNAYTNGFYCKGLQNKRPVRDSSSILNKCCKNGESLDGGFNCKQNPENYIAWKPTPEFMGSKFTRFEYNNFEASDEHLIIKLKMHEYTEEIYNNTRRKIYIKNIIKNYDSSMFCIDGYQEEDSFFAMIFAPCEANFCLQKCCEPGYYFHKNKNECIADTQMSEQTLEISTYIQLKRVNASADFFLIYSPTNCQHHEQWLFKNSVGYRKLGVQSNGNIAREVEKYTEYYWTTPFGYCIDIFSNGKVGLLNGFFCDKLERSGISSGRNKEARMMDEYDKLKKSNGADSIPKCIFIIHMLVSYSFVAFLYV